MDPGLVPHLVGSLHAVGCHCHSTPVASGQHLKSLEIRARNHHIPILRSDLPKVNFNFHHLRFKQRDSSANLSDERHHTPAKRNFCRSSLSYPPVLSVHLEDAHGNGPKWLHVPCASSKRAQAPPILPWLLSFTRASVNCCCV